MATIWDGMKEYMENKQEGQRKATLLHTGDIVSNIFENCLVLINGATEMDNGNLKLIIRNNGGNTQDIPNKSSITHLLQNKFNDSQLANLRKENVRLKYLFVTEAWVKDSISASRRLSERNYLPEDVKSIHAAGGSSGMNTLDSFAPKVKASMITAQDNPKEFLRSYIDNSRLHFIGTWASRLSQYLKTRTHLTSAMSPRRESASKGAGDRGRVVLHADLDCFFVSVLVRKRPELKLLPVCVAHGDANGETNEISSCNYAARKEGVEKGMWMEAAIKKCPALQVLPYDFKQYEEVTTQILDVIYTKFPGVLNREPVSCDEFYLELQPGSDGLEAAQTLRTTVMDVTHCPISVGVGTNKLTAKLATSLAKPPHGEGIAELPRNKEQFLDFMKSLNVDAIPGVGRERKSTLNENKISTCADLLSRTQEDIEMLLGKQVGETVYNAAQGIDNEKVEVVSPKSISTDVNWGIRFTSDEAAQRFLYCMAEELSDRMSDLGYYSFSSFTLKIMLRHSDASEQTTKFLGHGKTVDKSRKKLCTQRLASSGFEIYSTSLEVFQGLMVESKRLIKDLRGLNITIFLDNKSSEKVVSRDSAVDSKKPHQAKLPFVAQPKAKPKLVRRRGKVRSRFDFDDDDDVDDDDDYDDGDDDQVALHGGVGCKSIPPGQKKPTSNFQVKKKPNQKQDVILTSDMIVEGVTWEDLEQDKKAWEACLRLHQSRSAPVKVTETVWVVNDECELTLIPDSKNHYSASTDWLDKTGPFFSPSVFRRLSAGVSYLKNLMKGGNLRYPDEDFADIKVELVGGGIKLVDELAFDRAALLLRAVWEMGEVINRDGETQLGEDWGMLCNELERAVQERVHIVTCGGGGLIKWR